MKLEIPGQEVKMDVETGIEPVWYEKLALLFRSLGLLVERGGYSEGAYTPVITAPGGTTPPTYTAVPLTGRYIKVGRLCTVQIKGTNTVGGTPGAGVGQLSISLPLPVLSTSLGGRIIAGYMVNGAAENAVLAEGAAASSVAALYTNTVSGSKVNQIPTTGADQNNVTRSLILVFTYPVD